MTEPLELPPRPEATEPEQRAWQAIRDAVVAHPEWFDLSRPACDYRIANGVLHALREAGIGLTVGESA